MLRVIAAVLAASAGAFTIRSAPFARSIATALRVVPINVEALDDDLTGKLIEAELVDMLDREWIKQDCHRVLGRRARESYASARAAGLDDIGGILQHVGEALTSDAEGFDDAYVGPWDVANFVSDVLMARTSGDDDRCACSSSPSAAALDERAAALS